MTRNETTSNPRLIVSLLGSGWAAVEMVDVTVKRPDGSTSTYPDVQQTGIGRYRTREEAEQEAREWSESDEIPLVGISP